MASKNVNDEPFDWQSVLQTDSNVSPEGNIPSGAFSSLFNDFTKPDTPNKYDQRKNPNRRRPNFRKKRVDSADNDKNENRLTRSNIMPIKPSDEVQVKSYIDLVEEFLSNTDNVDSPMKSEIDCFISSIDNFEKSLKTLNVNDNSKEVVLKNLLEIQSIVGLKIKSLDPSYNRTENWVKNQTGSSELNLPRHNFEAVETSSYKSNSKSNASIKIPSLFTLSQEELKAVNCQYCCDRIADLPQLIKHMNYDCQVFRERDFDDYKRNDLSYFQILPDDKIKCNICEIKVNSLLLKKEHDKSVHHKKQVEKFKARDAKRNLTSYIYCSCCKINVPDSFIQFKMHLENLEHIEIKNKKNLGDLAEKGVEIVIMKQNKIKCLVCSHVEFVYEKEKFHHHSSDNRHIKSLKRKNMGSSKPIYCEICDENLSVFAIDFHIKSQVHSNNLNRMKNSDTSVKNQYCLFCNESFPNLTELALHQESDCSEIQNIRKMYQKSKDIESKKILTSQTIVNEDEDEEPFLQHNFEGFFKDKEWVTNAAVLLKEKSDKCDVDLDLSVAKECADEVGCKKYIIYGSRNNKLAFDSSDLNIYCNFFENMLLSVNERLLQVTAQECFHKLNRSEKFEDVKKFDKEASPFIQCVHKESRRNCKIAFKIETSELESDFFKKFLKENLRIQQFLLCLKLWLKVHSSYIGEFSSFTLIMLGVFFLKSKAAFVLPVPPLVDSISKELAANQSKSVPSEQSDLEVADLFLKFCKFYKDFDFSSWMIFTGSNEPLLKTFFESVLNQKSEKIPENHFTNGQFLWVVSYLNPSFNIGKDISKKILNRFVKVCDFTANRLSNS